MELPVAEDLLRNAENFNIAFGNVVHMNYANNSVESNVYNMTIQRDNISKHIMHLYIYCKPNICNRICQKGSYMRNYKYLEIPV